MKKSFRNFSAAMVTALGLASLVISFDAGAAGERRGGGGGGGGGGGNQARAQNTQVNNTKADARTNNVRSTSVNNVNVNKNVNVNVNNNNNGWNNDYHPVAAAVAVGATAAVIGSMVRTVPAGCVPVNHGGVVYQQCGGTYYVAQGSQYMVVQAP